MKAYGVNELRKLFLDFFASKGHLVVPSYSLIPHNDNSLLLINAGMAPLKPYFTGQEVPPRTRMATCQKCVRTGDIENVGKTARHLTFFEMLGNFSFGDYFKREAIHWSWEFLTQVLELDPARLYPSVYGEDEEAFQIWKEEIGVPEERIYRFYRDPETGECDNFWEHGAGPCGPCSEIYYDRGEKHGNGPEDVMGGEGDRFMEVWNNVFTQFENDGNGNYTELKQKNIDTGMGLERLAVVMQDVDSVFDIDTMKTIRDKVCEISGKSYETDALHDVSIRLITDHIRSAVFMISDGISPSNEGRGYVLRRLIRRAARHGKMLGIDGAFLSDLSKTVIDINEDAYPELREREEYISRVLTQEEEKFDKTIDQGLAILSNIRSHMEKTAKKLLSGTEAFRLYDTYGFPVDLTEEIMEEAGMRVDFEGFEKAMNEQREKARKARKKTDYMGSDSPVYEMLDHSISSEFIGYDTLVCDSEVLAMTTEEEVVESLNEGEKGTIITAQTPFYGTMGGQVGDTGVIETEEGAFEVEDTIHLLGGKIGHVGHMTRGVIRVGETAGMKVDEYRRKLIARNHSATHLLQKALRIVLGDHVHQAGSYVDANRLRFDFSHFSAMTDDEIRRVEEIVNTEIQAAIPVETQIMSLEEAKKTGAMALFGEKYGNEVRVVTMDDFSIELCGGTHVKNTSTISAFKIISESGVAAGVRRIEALTSDALFEYYDTLEKDLKQAAGLLKTNPAGVTAKIEQLQAEVKELQSEIESLKSKEAQQALGNADEKVEQIEGMNVIAAAVDNVDMNGLRELGDQLKAKIGEGLVFLASRNGGKVNLMAMATDGAVKKGVHAGNLIKAAAKKVGGGGGGRPNMAQAGGKNPEGIKDAMEEIRRVLKEELSK